MPLGCAVIDRFLTSILEHLLRHTVRLDAAFDHCRLNRCDDCAAAGQGSLNQILKMIGRSAARADIAGAH